jgi:hypothetical protein
MKEIREYLIAIARTGKITISYSKLVDQLDLHYDLRDENDREYLTEDVGEVSIFEHKKGRPMLSCLVIHKMSKNQGDAFYKIYGELHGIDWEEVRSKKKKYIGKEMDDVRAFWNDADNYKKYKDDY